MFACILIAGAAAGCGGTVALVPRDAVERQLRSPADAIRWFGPAGADRNPRWRAGVGPPVIRQPAAAASTTTDAITFVSWNTHLGAGDVVAFLNSLPNPRGPVVLLLQEVYRAGPEVPVRVDRGTSFARRHGGAAGGPHSIDVNAIAGALGYGVFYVPSMRNGGTRGSPEDRGNAILSNLPLRDLMAVELPFEHQRRVAVGATVTGETTAGTPWHVRFVCAHLVNTGGVTHAWFEPHRARQARALAGLLHDENPAILAGDFNTWFGFSDRAYTETARAFPDTRVTDRRATFRGLLRLDHVFFRLAPGWRAEFRRASSLFGSDHYPLVGSVRFN